MLGVCTGLPLSALSFQLVQSGAFIILLNAMVERSRGTTLLLLLP